VIIVGGNFKDVIFRAAVLIELVQTVTLLVAVAAVVGTRQNSRQFANFTDSSYDAPFDRFRTTLLSFDVFHQVRD